MMTTSNNLSGAFSSDHRGMTASILVMLLYGLRSMITELPPEFLTSGLGVSVGPFWFVAVSVVLLFWSFWGCLAIPVGGIVFGEIFTGDFSAFDAAEGLTVITLPWFFAISPITDPRNVKQITAVGFPAKAVGGAATWPIDVGKLHVGVEELEMISWLPEAVWATGGAGALFQITIVGVVFRATPTLFSYPRLRGKIEPLFGMSPIEGRGSPMFTRTSSKRLIAWMVLIPAVSVFEMLNETSGGLVTFTPEFAETYGQAFLLVPIAIMAVISFGLVVYCQRKIDGLQD